MGLCATLERGGGERNGSGWVRVRDHRERKLRRRRRRKGWVSMAERDHRERKLRRKNRKEWEWMGESKRRLMKKKLRRGRSTRRPR